MKLKLTEADLIRAISDYLQYQRNQSKLMYIRNNSGAMPVTDGKNKRRYIRFGDKGSPDFLVWVIGAMKVPVSVIYPKGDFIMVRYLKTIALEAKSETGKLSKDQKVWQADFEKIGGAYYVVRSVEEAIKIIEGR